MNLRKFVLLPLKYVDVAIHLSIFNSSLLFFQKFSVNLLLEGSSHKWSNDTVIRLLLLITTSQFFLFTLIYHPNLFLGMFALWNFLIRFYDLQPFLLRQ